ncbi:calcium/proton exchanger [Paenibacillus larvae]|uniref:Ca(2+)/H(+) antiporter n=3 Tax=Paenibacillus larvae TaxID=1464 RepID=A0A2L1TQ00_9BACL|nr:calcium/proton exchanger [Paenibacillus larvae]AQR76418.1 calcium/proton exchanger [Paenibacillus larvae subsp. larvae]AQZ48907.1 calcium/proton exchanger [Paenibacillus larvae subsp. pulvifaciens]AVF22755.1 calcium/proton exchanger [Paenibacillus larvae subsp. larvae]AVF27016.1 calcium/proton exchanger [Paenibacillus larvae subsp. larvae]AVF31763.1 calcium/proton exchanger [Paenibacillus larvae subsp. larvae]
MKKQWFNILLVGTFALSAIARFSNWNATFQFILYCIAIIFVAGFLGRATESVAYYSGERIGGFLNATFGNASELIIAFFLVKEGLFDMVKASLTGSIIGNLLFVFGLSALFGGMKYKEQTFNIKVASHNTSLMTLAVIALFVPAIFARGLTIKETTTVSLAVAIVLIIAYILWLYFSMGTHKKLLMDQVVEQGDPMWSKGLSIFFLILSTVMVAILSEWLVGTVEAFTAQFALSELFVGAFLIAIIGNAAEHAAAVILAVKNKIGASVEIAVGSSLQIAMFVGPVLVLASYFMGNTMDIVFSTYELVAILVAVLITKSNLQDGTSDWYEGFLHLAVYVILGIVFFLV